MKISARFVVLAAVAAIFLCLHGMPAYSQSNVDRCMNVATGIPIATTCDASGTLRVSIASGTITVASVTATGTVYTIPSTAGLDQTFTNLNGSIATSTVVTFSSFYANQIAIANESSTQTVRFCLGNGCNLATGCTDGFPLPAGAVFTVDQIYMSNFKVCNPSTTVSATVATLWGVKP